MNVLLILNPKYDITQVKVFIQTLPPTSTLLICGPTEPARLAQKVAARNGIPFEAVESDYPTEGVSFAASQVWYLHARRNKPWYAMTVRFAAAGKLLKGYFPSRFSTRKTFLLCTICNSLHGEGYRIEEIDHCQNCCVDKSALAAISATGPALVKLQQTIGYKVLTPQGRMSWPYYENNEIEVFANEEEWIDLAETRRRVDLKSEVKTASATVRL